MLAAKSKLKSIDIEVAVAAYLNFRHNLIVPNVCWGIHIHECDLLVITKAGYAWEVEIKVSKADLIKDADKRHGHKDNRIKDLYFAMPEEMRDCIDHVPERAGIILVKNNLRCQTIKKPISNRNAVPFSDKEKYKVARLGALRIWGLKRKIIKKDKED